MSSTIVRRSVVAGLGAAVGALAAAALMTTAPIASADDFDNDFTIGLGSSDYGWETTWDGTGLPVTTEFTESNAPGEEFGFSDSSTGDFTIGTHTFATLFDSGFFDSFSATGNEFEFLPTLLEIGSTF
jgi:hypothetical protein